MKKVHIVGLIGLILIIIYMALFVTNSIFGFFGVWAEVAFSILLIVISLSLISKGILLRSSSTLWFAMTLLLCAILILIFELVNLDTTKNYLFVFIPIISSVINLIVFRYKIYIKVIILNLSIALPVIMDRFAQLSTAGLVITYAVSIIMGTIICRLIYFKKESI